MAPLYLALAVVAVVLASAFLPQPAVDDDNGISEAISLNQDIDLNRVRQGQAEASDTARPLEDSMTELPSDEGLEVVPGTLDADADNGTTRLDFNQLSQQTFEALEPKTNIQKVVSPKGIEAWLVEEYAVPLIALEVGFHGGSRRDPDGKAGLARMTSALLDEGAGEYTSGEFQQRLEDLAIRMRFSSGRDAVYGSVRTLAARRDEAMDMFRLALTQPRFDAEPVSRIRQQLLVAIKREKSDPSVIAQETWFDAILGDHVYANPVKGTPDSLHAITSEDLRWFVANSFARDNLKISVVGAISAEELAVVLDETFGDLPEASATEKMNEAEVAANGQMLVYEREQPQSVVMFGLEGLKIDDPDFIPAFVMNYILGGGGFSSRLMEEVREKKGLAYGIHTNLLPLDYGALYYGSVGTDNNRISETVDIIKSEFARMRDNGVGEKELNDAKTYLTGSFALRFDSNAKIANQLVGYQLTGRGIDYINKRNALVNAVTVDDIARAAKRVLHPDKLTFVIVGQPQGLNGTQVIRVN